MESDDPVVFWVRIKKYPDVLTLPVHQSRLLEVPATFVPPAGYIGIDLTPFTVMHGSYSGGVRVKLKTLREKHPNAIVVYEFDWIRGKIAGILLPSSFNPPKRLKFFKDLLH